MKAFTRHRSFRGARKRRKLMPSVDGRFLALRSTNALSPRLRPQTDATTQRKVVNTDKVEQRRQHIPSRDGLCKSCAELSAFFLHFDTAMEAQRARIARELHDIMGAYFTGLKLDLTLLCRAVEACPENASTSVKLRASDMMQTVDTAIATVRQVAIELRPTALDGLGLMPAIDIECDRFRSRTGCVCKVESDTLPPLSSTQSNGLFRMFTECLTNVARHANAQQVVVRIGRKAKNIVMSICDDGCGFDVIALGAHTAFGLMSIRERARLLDGSVEVHSAPGCGTTVTITIPVEQENPRSVS